MFRSAADCEAGRARHNARPPKKSPSLSNRGGIMVCPLRSMYPQRSPLRIWNSESDPLAFTGDGTVSENPAEATERASAPANAERTINEPSALRLVRRPVHMHKLFHQPKSPFQQPDKASSHPAFILLIGGPKFARYPRRIPIISPKSPPPIQQLTPKSPFPPQFPLLFLV